MADRAAYTNCMKPWMSGGGPDRKLRFCTGAKVCSSKAATEEEARQICLSEPPKEPKIRKFRKKSDCGKEMTQVAACLAPLLNAEVELTLSKLTGMLQQCACGKVEEKTSREKFIKKCFKENSSNGLQVPLKEAAALRSLCTAKWKEGEISERITA